MRGDSKGIDIHRQRERVAHREILFARGNSHIGEECEGGGKLNRKHAALRGLFGEVEANDSLFHLFLASRMEMLLDNEIRPLGERTRNSIGKEMRLRAASPPAQRSGAARKSESRKS